MPFRPDLGYWIPLLSPDGSWCRAEDLFFLESKSSMAPAVLVSGPRETGKTLAVINKLLRHLWLTPNARVAVINKTVKNAKPAGVIKDFTDYVIPNWIEAKLLTHDGKDHLRYTSKDSDGNYGGKSDGATKTWFFKIRNYWGGESELLLFSLDHDHDVEDKFKQTRFSAIYFPELDRFKDPKVFTVSHHQLRMIGLRPEQHLWIADTNPAEEGPDHFAYKFWYEKNRKVYEEAGIEKEEIDDYLSAFVLMEFHFEDNPWLTKHQITQNKLRYLHDEDLYNRYVLGLWTRVRAKGDFKDVFSRNVHVVGDITPVRKENWEVLVPYENCVELQTGWDMGDVNHSVHIGCKRPIDESDPYKFAYDVLDELVFIKEKISIADLASLVIEKMDFYEKLLADMYGHKKILWRHWSDRSAFRYRSSSDAMDELIVRDVSQGRILLHSPNIQGRGGIAHRIQLLRRLLFEQRIMFSAHLFSTIEMLVNAERSDLMSTGKYKHPFDSLTYWIAGEEPQSVERNNGPKTNRPPRLVTLGAR